MLGSNKYFTVSLKTGENWLRNNTGHWSIGSFAQHLTTPVMLIGKVIAPGYMKRICNLCNNTTLILLSIIARVRSILNVQGTDGTEIPAGELHHTRVIRKHITYVRRKVRIRTIFLRKPRILAPSRYPRIAQTSSTYILHRLWIRDLRFEDHASEPLDALRGAQTVDMQH